MAPLYIYILKVQFRELPLDGSTGSNKFSKASKIRHGARWPEEIRSRFLEGFEREMSYHWAVLGLVKEDWFFYESKYAFYDDKE